MERVFKSPKASLQTECNRMFVRLLGVNPGSLPFSFSFSLSGGGVNKSIALGGEKGWSEDASMAL